MVGWPHRLNGPVLEQTLGECEGREAWHTEVMGSQRVRYDLVTE